MQIISKRAFTFVDWLIEEVNGEKMAKAQRTFPVRPSVYPQTAPDWIVNDDLFTLAMQDGNLSVISK